MGIGFSGGDGSGMGAVKDRVSFDAAITDKATKPKKTKMNE